MGGMKSEQYERFIDICYVETVRIRKNKEIRTSCWSERNSKYSKDLEWPRHKSGAVIWRKMAVSFYFETPKPNPFVFCYWEAFEILQLLFHSTEIYFNFPMEFERRSKLSKAPRKRQSSRKLFKGQDTNTIRCFALTSAYPLLIRGIRL